MSSDGEVNAGAAAATSTYRPEFKASGREYFRIWIVNLALTIATLGIYSAWAKVRKLRYFYSNTSLAGSAFGYHAEPLKILKGRIIAAILAAAYIASARYSPKAAAIAVLVIGAITPWLVVKSRMFALRMTSWRGVRFGFEPDYRGAYASLLGYMVAAAITFGILYPRAVRERYRFIVSRSSFGTTRFSCEPGVFRFYKTALVAVGLMIVGFVPLLAVLTIVVATFHIKRGSQGGAVTQLVIVAGYMLVFTVIHGYTQARNLNEVISTSTVGRHRLRCKLRARTLMALYLTNVLSIVFTLGLCTPWAQVRLARYRLQAIELEAQGTLEDFVPSPVANTTGPVGEELSGFLDVDFGF